MSKRVIIFLLSFVLLANGLESKKPYQRKGEIPPYPNRIEDKPFGKLFFDTWTPCDKSEGLFRGEILPFLGFYEEDDNLGFKARSKLRLICQYVKELVDEEWEPILKDLSSDALIRLLEGAVTADYSKLIHVLCDNEKLGENVIFYKSKYEPITLPSGVITSSLKPEVIFAEQESERLTEIFDEAIKKGNERNLNFLIKNERIRKSLLYAYSHTCFSEDDFLYSFPGSFFSALGKTSIVKHVIENNRIMWVTVFDNDYVELFEMMIDNDEVKDWFNKYCLEIANDSFFRPQIIRMGTGAFPQSWGAYLNENTSAIQVYAMSGTEDFTMTVYAKPDKRITYLACKRDHIVSDSDHNGIVALLSCAAEKDCLKAVEFILKNKDALGITTHDIQRALLFATSAGAERVLPLLQKEGGNKERAIEFFSDEDIVRAFLLTWEGLSRDKVKTITETIMKKCKDRIVSYACQNPHEKLVLPLFIFGFKHQKDIVETLLNNKKCLETIKQSLVKRGLPNREGSLDFLKFFIEKKELFGLTVENTFESLKDFVFDNTEKAKLLLENFDYSSDQLQEILNLYGIDEEILNIVRSKMNQ